MYNKVLIPGRFTYKEIDIESGKVRFHFQPKNKTKRITNIYIYKDGKKYLFSRIEERQLTILLTTKCNHRCIMCPQQLNIDSIDNDLIIKRIIENLDYSVIDEIYLTGGEPMLKIDFINELLQKTPERIFITILTNGTILPSKKVLSSPRCKLCIPLYASYDSLHNHITGSNSFYNVINNLIAMSNYPILIELRYVMNKQNINNIKEYARFVHRNLPFVQDVAFMGMELTASAKKNKGSLWINPREYISDLIEAVRYLDNFEIRSWIYNLQPCLFDEQDRNFLSPSISLWKRRYLPICTDCKLKNTCGGIFFSDMIDYKDAVLRSVK